MERIIQNSPSYVAVRACTFFSQVSRELQDRVKFEITGTRVLRQKLKQRFRAAGQVRPFLQFTLRIGGIGIDPQVLIRLGAVIPPTPTPHAHARTAPQIHSPCEVGSNMVLQYHGLRDIYRLVLILTDIAG